ncbi:hypothetical protein AAG906_039173 [Vitis piasezkii]
MQGPVARVIARAVARVACLGSTRGHHEPRATHDGTGNGTCRVSWLGSWAPCKAAKHASWHGGACVPCLGSAHGHNARPRGRRQGTDRGTIAILALLMGTMQGLGARIVARAVACVPCLGSAHGHNARPHGTPWHGRWHALRVLARLVGTIQGLGHASWHERWHASRVLARLVFTMQGPMAHVMARVVARIPCLSSTRGHHARPRGTRHGTSGGTRPVS